MRVRPVTLIGAAVVQAAEALGLLVATVIAGVDTASGRSYQATSGIALTLIGIGAAAVLVVIALGLRRARRWSRTPALLTQVFSGIVAIYLIDGHRYGWGVPLIVLAVAGLGLLVAPATWRALTSEFTGPRG